MRTWRRTKIVATLGPALDTESALTAVMEAGANVFRANFSHGTADDHKKRIELVRNVSKKLGQEVAIFADLQGPKIRVARFKNKKVVLKPGQAFVLDMDLNVDDGNEHQVGVDYKGLADDLNSGDKLLLDDGRVVFVVNKIEGKKIHCTVEVGGELSNNKGINRQGGGLSAAALTEKDKEDLKTAVKLNVDYIAISFPRNAEDMEYAKQLIAEAGGKAGVIAKIERAEAIENIDEIIVASDAIMIARGDLGVEIGDAQLPAVQKELIQKARDKDKAVITATQMMESMITNSIPTRAEVFDVANAVLDGTDAVMLSSETAMGDHPVEAVEAMSRICEGSEKENSVTKKRSNYSIESKKVDRAISMACMLTADNLNAIAIAALTESGSTALWMSRTNHSIPIFALTTHIGTLRKVTLYRGVYPARIKTIDTNHATVNKDAINVLTELGVAKENDLVIITKGDLAGIRGGTNAMKVVTVGHLTDG